MLFLDEVPTIPFLEIITAIALMQPIGQILRFPLQIYYIPHIHMLLHTVWPFLMRSHDPILHITRNPGCIHIYYCQIENLLKK